MKIAPLDLRRARFGSSMRGFNRTEVVSFLNEAADGYEQALRDTARLQREVDTLQNQFEEHCQAKATMRDTRLTLQRVSAEVREGAKSEVQLIEREAHSRADELVRKAGAPCHDVEQEMTNLVRKPTDVAASIEGSIVALRHALEAVKQQNRDRLQEDKRHQHQPGSDARRTGTVRPAPRPIIPTAESRPSA